MVEKLGAIRFLMVEFNKLFMYNIFELIGNSVTMSAYNDIVKNLFALHYISNQKCEINSTN